MSPNVDGVGCIVVDHTNLEDSKDTEPMTDPPAPQTGDIVHYETFVEISAEVLEDRWLIGDPPDISSLANADLRAELNRQIVDLAAVARDIGLGIKEDDVTETVLDTLAEEVTELKSVVDEIERRQRL